MYEGAKSSTLVFLHFFGGSARSWDGVADRLGEEFETILLDLPGFGTRADACGPFTIASYADWVAKTTRVLALEDYILVGHSMGGKIALALAMRRPAGLRALVLLAPSPPTPEPIEEDARARLLAGWHHYGLASEILARATDCALSGDLRERTIADIMKSCRGAWESWLRRGNREDISGSMDRIDVPVTVLSGECDLVLPTALIKREVVDRLSRASLVTVLGAGHLLPLEAPEAVAAAIKRIARQRICPAIDGSA